MELGFGEIVVILVVVLLLFGPSKLPKVGEGLGSAIANFRKAMRDEAPRGDGDNHPAPRALPGPEDASAPADGARGSARGA